MIVGCFVSAAILLSAFVAVGTANRSPHPRRALLRQPALSGRVDRSHSRVLRHVRHDVLRQPVHAVRAGLLRPSIRRRAHSGRRRAHGGRAAVRQARRVVRHQSRRHHRTRRRRNCLLVFSFATTTSGYGLVAAVLILVGVGMGLGDGARPPTRSWDHSHRSGRESGPPSTTRRGRSVARSVSPSWARSPRRPTPRRSPRTRSSPPSKPSLLRPRERSRTRSVAPRSSPSHWPPTSGTRSPPRRTRRSSTR